MSCHFYANGDIDMHYFYTFSCFVWYATFMWDIAILVNQEVMIQFQHVNATNLILWILPPGNDHRMIIEIIPYPYIVPHLNANELLYVFLFHICDFNNNTLCDYHLNRSNVTKIFVILLPLTFFMQDTSRMMIKITNMEY